jgi:hypothetical protein
MTSSAAARAGIPAIIATAGGRAQLEEEAVALLVDGVETRSGGSRPPARPPRS